MEVTLITIEGIESSNTSDNGGKSDNYRGRRRGPARAPQFLRAGGLLAVVALVLLGVGVAVVWTSDSDVFEAGRFDASKVPGFCDAVDSAVFSEWGLIEESRKPGDVVSQSAIPRSKCVITLIPDEDTTSYLAVTISADFRVQETVGDAAKAFAGAIDYEKSKSRPVDERSKPAEETGLVIVSSDQEQQEYHVHLRESNALLSITMLVSGAPLSEDDATSTLLSLGSTTLDVMGSE